MYLGSPQLETAQIVIACGYDLIARAIADTLNEQGLQPAMLSVQDLATASAPQADILILDDATLNPQGFEPSLAEIRDKLPTTRIIIIDSTCSPQRILQASRLGVRGYLYLGDRLRERLKGAVTDVLEGGIYFSPSAAAALAEAEHLAEQVLPRINAYHRQVLSYMAQYWPAGQIANQLGRSTQAIYQVQRYLRTLFDVDSNGALLERAGKWGLIQASAQ